MQLLKITESTTLADLSNTVGERNAQLILTANNLKRTPNIGKQFKTMCDNIINQSPEVDTNRKVSLLNSLTSDSDIFESTALQGEDGWKLTSAIGTLPNMLKVPDSITLPDSVNILGNNQSVGNRIYGQVMQSLQATGEVDPGIFNEYTGLKNSQLATSYPGTPSDVFQWFKIPWGKVTLYSSIENISKDFPVYPEEVSDGYTANYTQMPDMLYQYEPWQCYQSSGPRSNTYTFRFHRDMWTGNHTDGKANELIRFCEANCFPEYQGSAVNVPTVTLYIAGTAHISGILTDVSVRWSGPLGSDGWYLACEVALSITEVAETPLDYHSVKNKGLIGAGGLI